MYKTNVNTKNKDGAKRSSDTNFDKMLYNTFENSSKYEGNKKLINKKK